MSMLLLLSACVFTGVIWTRHHP